VLLDRDGERQEIDRLLGVVRGGLSGSLVLRGEAGVGKTALLQYAAESAGDMLVTRVVGVESEMELGFAGLQQSLIPFLPPLERLAAPQRDALGSAFGLVSAPPPDLFLVGLAALTLLADAAVERPVFCVVDDAQWVDRGSAGALGFVARRLFADRIGMLFVVREESGRPEALERLVELRVQRLPEDAARDLLASVAVGTLGRRVGERIVFETRGNPLALIELGDELTADELSGSAPLRKPLPIGRRLEARFLSRVRRLPAQTQTLLLLAAAQQLGDPVLLWRAAAQLGIGAEAADPLVRAAALARSARGVSPPADALGRLPGCSAARSPPGTRGSGRRDRSRARPRSSCLAPRRSRCWTRRGHSGRARALRRARGQPRWACQPSGL
jgi:hypothetical protein